MFWYGSVGVQFLDVLQDGAKLALVARECEQLELEQAALETEREEFQDKIKAMVVEIQQRKDARLDALRHEVGEQVAANQTLDCAIQSIGEAMSGGRFREIAEEKAVIEQKIIDLSEYQGKKASNLPGKVGKQGKKHKADSTVDHMSNDELSQLIAAAERRLDAAGRPKAHLVQHRPGIVSAATTTDPLCNMSDEVAQLNVVRSDCEAELSELRSEVASLFLEEGELVTDTQFLASQADRLI